MAMSKMAEKKVWKVLILIFAVVLVCLFAILSYKKIADAEREPFYGTWRIEKVALVSDMYTGTTLDGDFEENLYDSEDFLGYELEYTDRYFRIGDKKYNNPEYIMEYETVKDVNRGIKARPVDIHAFLAREEILVNNEEDYTGETLLLRFDVDFADEVSYGKYNFIPVGTQCILLNEDAMIVGIWGKTLLARRIE